MARSRPVPARPVPARLGRGLGNLIPVPVVREVVERAVPETAAPVAASSGSASSVAHAPHPARQVPEGDAISTLPIGSLIPGHYQPRTEMDTQGIMALAESIQASGLMQPIVVRPSRKHPGSYEIVAGERRWRALQSLGHTHAPAVIREVSDQHAAELALVENLQREDLNPMDRAVALQRLVEEFEATHAQLASRLGLDRASISNLLRLNDLDSHTAALVRSGKLSLGHAKVLVAISDPSMRAQTAQRAAELEWSVRQLESELQSTPDVPRGTRSSKSKAPAPNAHIARVERELQEHLGTRVSIRLSRKKGAGEVRISFFTLDEFDGVMQRIGFGERGSRLTV